MLVKKVTNEYNSYDIILIDGNKQLKIYFMGNLDLYWSIYDYDKDIDDKVLEFMITKDNYRIYELFDILFNRVKNCEVSRFDYTEMRFCNNIEELKERIERIKWFNDSIRRQEEYNPNKLFKNNMIEWHCDDASYEDAHVLKIMKNNEDSYLIRIQLNEKEQFNRHSIRFRNDRSGHNPFNVLFMDMFNKLQDYNVDDKRIHIEEYIYQKKLRRD